MKKKILTGALLGLMMTMGTAAFAQGTSGVHIGAQVHFKQLNLLKVIDQYFMLESDMQGTAAYEIAQEENERILIIH